MKSPRLIAVGLLFCVVVLLVASCAKVKYAPAPASVNVINAMPVSNPIAPLFGAQQDGQYLAGLNTIGMLSSYLYSPVAGQMPLLIVSSADTNVNIFKGNMTFLSGSIYSLFLSGDTAHADTTLTVDHIPNYTDSSVGARFINLVKGSLPMEVNLAGNDPHSTPEFTNIGYKQITAFKQYSATAEAAPESVYNFEIRDQASDSLLAQYSWGYTLYRNQTLVISGSLDPAAGVPIQVFVVNNF